MGKITILISIVLISLLAVSTIAAVSAVSDEDIALSGDTDLTAIEEEQTIDNVNADDSINYDSNDVSEDNFDDLDGYKSGLGANQLSEGEGTFTELQNEISSASDVLNLTRDYKHVYDDGYLHIIIRKNITINGGGHTLDGGDKDRYNYNVSCHFWIDSGCHVIINDLNFIHGSQSDEGGSINVASASLTLNNCNFTDNIADYIYTDGPVVRPPPVNPGPPLHVSGNGGAIFARSGTLVINNCNFYNNTAYLEKSSRGGAIYVYEGSLVINNSNFTENKASEGGAIFSWNAKVTIDNCQFKDNYQERLVVKQPIYGGAIRNYQGSVMVIKNSSFIGNSAFANKLAYSAYGGAIYNDGTLNVSECRFSDNYANSTGNEGMGGAIFNSRRGTLYVNSSDFTGNHAKANGGAIFNQGIMTVSESNFTNNYANKADSIYNNKTMSLSGNKVTGSRIGIFSTTNSSIESPLIATLIDGQSITTTAPEVELYGVLMDDAGNLVQYQKFKFLFDGKQISYSSYDEANGIYNANYTFNNPGTYVLSTNLNNVVITTGQYIFENPLILLQGLIDVADDGDEINMAYGYRYAESYDSELKDTGIIVNKSITINGNGLAIDGASVSRLFKIVNNATLILNNITLSNGHSGWGGAVYVEEGSLRIFHSLLLNNTARNDGGAIYSDDKLEISKSSFVGNHANGNNAKGGAVYTAGQCIISDSSFNENFANDYGGAISSEGIAVISNSTFTKNLARFGGAMYSSGELNVSYSNFTLNNASNIGGAIAILDRKGKLNIENSIFNNNSAFIGAALHIYANARVVNSSFDSNTAADDGGAIYNSLNSTILDSNFTDNKANGHGDAICNDMEMYLSNNKITGSEVAIYNTNRGNFSSPIDVVLLGDQDLTISTYKYNFTALIKDDAGNPIQYEIFTFLVDGQPVAYTSFDDLTGIYQVEYTFNRIATYNISAKYNDKIVSRKISLPNSLSLLQYIIDNAEEEVIDLDSGFEYCSVIDNELKYIGVIINKTVVINGNGFTIDGLGYSRLFNITDGGNLSINSLNLKGGFAFPNGGAVFIEKNSSLNAYKCNFTENKADYGAVIYQSGNASINIRNCSFDDNRVYFEGGSIFIADEFSDYGIYDPEETGTYGLLKIEDSIFERSDAIEKGGVISINNSNIGLDVNNTIFIFSSARYGGAIYSIAPTRISHSYFEGNRASWFGGALYIDSNSPVKIECTDFLYNSAIRNGQGGAIYLKSQESSNSIFENLNFTHNNALKGSAIYSAGAMNLDINNTLFSFNEAEESGAIHLDETAVAKITNSVFDSNSGGAEVYDIDRTEGTGLTLENNTFKTVHASLVIDKLVYLVNEDVNVGGSFIWGVKDAVIDLKITEFYHSLVFTKDHFSIGEFSFTLSDLQEGIYSLDIIPFEDNNGNKFVLDSVATETFTVGNVILKTSLEINDVSIVDDVIANVFAYDESTNQGIRGIELHLFVDGVEYTLTTGEDGKASKNIGKMDIKNYTGFVSFFGNERFGYALASDDFSVFDTPEITVNIDDISLGEDAIATVYLKDSLNNGLKSIVELNLSFLEDPILVFVKDGIGSVRISDLGLGTYTYYAKFDGLENYLAATTEVKTFRVYNLENTFEIDFNQDKLNFGDIINGTISIDSLDGQATANNVGIIIKKGDLTVYETTIDEINGRYNFVYDGDLDVGQYTLTVTVPTQGDYSETTKAFNLEVVKSATHFEADDIVVYATVAKTICFTLKDSNGNVLADKSIAVLFDGKTYNLTTDSEGIIELEVNMANKGSYSISTSFTGDEDYESSVASFNVVVKTKATKLTVANEEYSISSTKYLTASLTSDGQPLANKIVTFAVNGKTYTGRTNENGLVNVAVSLTAKKTYSVVATFAGDSTYGTAVASYKLKVTS